MPSQSKLMFKYSTYSILTFAALYFGYLVSNIWVQFIISTTLIFAISAYFFGKSFPKLLGLSASRSEWIRAIVVGFLFWGLSYFVVMHVLESKGHTIIVFDYLSKLLITPFQTLNEEIVFRALLLGGMIRLGFKRNAVIILPAVIFSLLHWVFYHFNLSESNRGDLEWTALVTLMLFGIATNAFYFRFRNITIPWALHFAWNANRFGGGKVVKIGEMEVLPEFATFNLIEASPSIVLMCAAMTAVCLWYCFRKTGGAV